MATGTIYPYCSSEAFNSPQHYMYSAYHGETFVEEYFRIREGACKDLRSKLSESALIKANSLIESLNITAVNVVLRSGLEPSITEPQISATSATAIADSPPVLESLQLLREMYSARVLKPCESHGEAIPYSIELERFLRAFERKRLIHSHYEQPFRERGSSNVVENYALLGALLGQALCFDPTVRTLNALLKVNDVLCGVIPLIDGDALVVPSLVGLTRELWTIRNNFKR